MTTSHRLSEVWCAGRTGNKGPSPRSGAKQSLSVCGAREKRVGQVTPGRRRGSGEGVTHVDRLGAASSPHTQDHAPHDTHRHSRLKYFPLGHKPRVGRNMTQRVNRRILLAAAASTPLLAACGGVSTSGGGEGAVDFLSTQFLPVEERQRFEKVLADHVKSTKVAFNSVEASV